MSDTTLLQLIQHCAEPAAPVLLVLDENAGPLPPNPFADALVISNRSDIAEAARVLHWPCEFSDFRFDVPACAGRQRALYRISKEKRVVEHVLQSLWQLLPDGGELCCAGYKNEGIKTFAKRAAQAWQSAPVLTRGIGNLHLYTFRKTGRSHAALNPTDYHALQPIGAWHGHEVYSKPGIFAWDRFDEGSRFLLDYLPVFLQQHDCTAQQALDLGCGAGLLALALLEAGCAGVTATDNNAAALCACEFTLSRHPRAGHARVVAADCGAGIAAHFDIVLCNPPFHRGFGVDQDLTERFLAAARHLLAPGGRALFVVNSFIPLERKAAALFGQVQTVADERRYKLVELGAGSPRSYAPRGNA
jgi:16S rRNA (guanine1207-N2)-methyltransferase